MRFYLDEDVTSRLVGLLREFGHDVLHTDAAGRKSASDASQLTFARSHDRVTLTCNVRDFSLLHEAWTYCSREVGSALGHGHPGILLVPNSSRFSDADLITIVQEFSDSMIDPSDRLFRWRRLDGWRLIDVTAD